MGKKSRTKGKAGELEVVNMLKTIFPDVKRELAQYQGSMSWDLANTDFFRIQVKRRKTPPAVEAILKEVAVGIDPSETPVLMIRGDNGRWLAVMYADDWIKELGFVHAYATKGY